MCTNNRGSFSFHRTVLGVKKQQPFNGLILVRRTDFVMKKT